MHGSQKIFLLCTHSQEATWGSAPLKQGNKIKKVRELKKNRGSGPIDTQRHITGQSSIEQQLVQIHAGGQKVY